MLSNLFRLPFAAALLFSSCALVTKAPNRPGTDQYGITEMSGSVDLAVVNRVEKRESSGGKGELQELRFQEQVRLALTGFYYHPKLMEFDLATNFGLTQRTVDSGPDDQNDIDGQDLGWDFVARFFKELDYAGEIFTSRSQNLTRQSFFATTKSEREKNGLRLFARGWWIPSKMELSHSTLDSRGRFPYSEVRDNMRMEGFRDEDEEATKYQYFGEINQVESQGQSQPFQDLSVYASVNHSLGNRLQHQWNNSVSLRGQDSGASSESLSLNSSYSHQFTKKLSWLNSSDFSSSSLGGTSTDSFNFSTSLSHQLFSSLNSNGALNWGTTRFGTGSVDTYGGIGSVIYTKKIPIGTLGLSQSIGVSVQDRGALQGSSIVLGESFVVNPGIPLYLNNIAVDSSSVVVRDSSGLIIYLRGLDYFVVQIGSQTQIEVPVTSRISSGDTISVDYSFSPTPEQKIESISSGSSASLSIFEMLSMSVSRSTSVATLKSGFDDGALEDTARTVARVQFTPWSITSLQASYEDVQSNLSPFENISASVSQDIPLFDRLSWRTSASTFRTTFPYDPRAVTGSKASMNLTSRISPTMFIGLNGEYHKSKFRTDQGDGYFAELEMKKSIGKTTFSLSARYIDETFEVTEDISLMLLQFHVTREF